MMNEYREEFNPRREGDGTPPGHIPDVHHGTNNSWGSKRSTKRLSRNTCGSPARRFSAVKYGRRKCRHVLLRAILFYLCLNILKHCAARTPPITLSSCLLSSPNRLFEHLPVILDVSENVKLSVSLMHLLARLKDVKRRQNDAIILERDIF